mgnify:CR=1 FL=1
MSRLREPETTERPHQAQSTVHHDSNNPLSIISGNGQFLLELSRGEELDDQVGPAGQDLQFGGPVTVYRPFESYSETGALGDVEAASAEKGERFFEGVVGELADLLRQAHERGR